MCFCKARSFSSLKVASNRIYLNKTIQNLKSTRFFPCVCVLIVREWQEVLLSFDKCVCSNSLFPFAKRSISFINVLLDHIKPAEFCTKKYHQVCFWLQVFDSPKLLWNAFNLEVSHFLSLFPQDLQSWLFQMGVNGQFLTLKKLNKFFLLFLLVSGLWLKKNAKKWRFLTIFADHFVLLLNHALQKTPGGCQSKSFTLEIDLDWKCVKLALLFLVVASSNVLCWKHQEKTPKCTCSADQTHTFLN